MVEQTEIPEPVHEHLHHVDHSEHGDNAFRRWAAIYVGVVAMLLAISSLGGGHVTKEMLSANIHASDTYAFAQAKYLRATVYQLAADQMEFEFNHLPELSDAGKAKAAERVEHYRSNAAALQRATRQAAKDARNCWPRRGPSKQCATTPRRRTPASSSPRRCSRSRSCSARCRSSRFRARYWASARR